MTVVRLADGGLWVHSPVRATPARFAEVERLGEIRHLVAPNPIHHLSLGDGRDLPGHSCADTRAPGHRIRRRLRGRPGPALPRNREIDTLSFRGSAVMAHGEVVEHDAEAFLGRSVRRLG